MQALKHGIFFFFSGTDRTAMWTLGQVDNFPPPMSDTKNKNTQVIIKSVITGSSKYKFEQKRSKK